MLTMFKPVRGEKRKAVIDEINHDIKTTFDKVFADNYPIARESLLRGGIPESKVDEKLSEIRASLQQKMIIEAKQLLRKAILSTVKEQQQQAELTEDNTVKSQPDDELLIKNSTALSQTKNNHH